MIINGISGGNTQAGQLGMNQAADSYSRNLQKQIENAKKQLQELSSNQDMTLEEKMTKRQEIQKQITDLNNQLRQHQMEQRREQQQAKGSSMEDYIGGSKKSGAAKQANAGRGFSQTSMKAMISADSSMKQAQVQGSVATKMEGRAGVLKAEIKQDAGRGDVEAKKEELAEVEQIAEKATVSQMNTLSEADKAVKEAAKAEQTDTAKTAENKETRTDTEKTEKKEPEKEGTQEKVTETTEQAGKQTSETVSPDAVSEALSQAAYTSVDVRL